MKTEKEILETLRVTTMALAEQLSRVGVAMMDFADALKQFDDPVQETPPESFYCGLSEGEYIIAIAIMLKIKPNKVAGITGADYGENPAQAYAHRLARFWSCAVDDVPDRVRDTFGINGDLEGGSRDY